MFKFSSGSKVYIQDEWKEMYYSHIGFPCLKVIIDKNHSIEIQKNMDISAYYVDTYANYKGYKCQILGIDNNIISLNPSVEYQSMSKDHAKPGYDPQLKVKEHEIEEIWEERKPIEGFKFDVKPIRYIKKNGKYL